MTKSPYPKMAWEKDGTPHLVTKPAEDSADFLPCHPDDPDFKAKVKAMGGKPPEADYVPMSRDEVIAALTSGKVQFDASADDDALSETLRESLSSAMSAKSLVIKDGMTLREMLAAVTA